MILFSILGPLHSESLTGNVSWIVLPVSRRGLECGIGYQMMYSNSIQSTKKCWHCLKSSAIDEYKKNFNDALLIGIDYCRFLPGQSKPIERNHTKIWYMQRFTILSRCVDRTYHSRRQLILAHSLPAGDHGSITLLHGADSADYECL